MSGSDQDTVPDAREWSGGPHGWSGGPPGCPGVVGRQSWVVGRPFLDVRVWSGGLTGGWEALLDVW